MLTANALVQVVIMAEVVHEQCDVIMMTIEQLTI